MEKKVLILGLLVLLLSCRKEGSQPCGSTSVNATNENGPVAQAKPIPGANATHWSDGWCRQPANNCVILKEIVIIRKVDMLVLEDAVEGGAGEVAAAFSSGDFDYINDELEQDVIADLVSGDYYIGISNEDDESINYIFGTSSPVTGSNLDFSLEFSKEPD